MMVRRLNEIGKFFVLWAILACFLSTIGSKKGKSGKMGEESSLIDWFLGMDFCLAASSLNCENISYPRSAFRSQPDDSKVYMRVSRIEDKYFERAGVVKFCSVFGIRILADKEVDDEKLLHLARNLAELLDSKGVGKPASDPLIKTMLKRHATLAIAKSNERVDEVFSLLPSDYECVFFLVIETEEHILPGAPQEPDCLEAAPEFDSYSFSAVSNHKKYDRSIGLIADFVIQAGYPHTYPPNTDLGIMLHQAFFDSIKNKWLNVKRLQDDQGNCDTKCLETAFQYWALTSALGVDSCTCRKSAVWKLCSPIEMKKADPMLFAVLTQDIIKPYGYYFSKSLIQ